MLSGDFRVTLNGFRVMTETWDDMWQGDGKRDEVQLSTGITVASARTGNVIYRGQPTSPVLGDTNNQNGRVRAGSASNKGGLRSGDSFPTSTPWIRDSLNIGRDWPPCKVWEGTLTQGEDVCLIVPTIWEYDPGQHFLEGWADWAFDIGTKIRDRLPSLVGPHAQWQVNALSLGLDLAVSIKKITGTSASRPIGMKPDPKNRDTHVFDPYVLVLNYDTADRIAREEPSGRGRGVLAVRYLESPDLRGDYMLYLQVDRVDNDTRPVRLRSANYPDRFIQHRNFLVELVEPTTDGDRRDNAFVPVPGLSDPAGVSFESISFPGHYLRHQGFELKLQPRTEDALFMLDATFRELPGLADPKASSFESVNYPGHFLRHRGFRIYLDPAISETLYRQDATFFRVY
ncbi:hypothetical protein GCM10023107_79280 [Actinoplanes octamycinicus]|nr:hypothetical protein Aoc01nite_63920 [Actinoplanes octamycinicus]